MPNNGDEKLLTIFRNWQLNKFPNSPCVHLFSYDIPQFLKDCFGDIFNTIVREKILQTKEKREKIIDTSLEGIKLIEQ